MGHVRLTSLLLLCGVALALGCAGEAQERREDGPPGRPGQALLACGVLERELGQALRARYRAVRIAPPGEVPECDRAALAVTSVGAGCIERADCETPPAVEGTVLPLPESRYDAVLMFDASSPAPAVRESRCVSPPGGRDAAGRRVRCRRHELVTISPAGPPGWSGLVFLFRPRSGQLVAGRRFAELRPEGLIPLLDGLR